MKGNKPTIYNSPNIVTLDLEMRPPNKIKDNINLTTTKAKARYNVLMPSKPV